jgi:site-specific DNA recombinase
LITDAGGGERAVRGAIWLPLRRKSEHVEARYDVVVHEAAIVAELFCRYVEDGVSIAELARWLTSTAAPTRTGESRWDRSVIWAMLRNPPTPGALASARSCAPPISPDSTASPG